MEKNYAEARADVPDARRRGGHRRLELVARGPPRDVDVRREGERARGDGTDDGEEACVDAGGVGCVEWGVAG